MKKELLLLLTALLSVGAADQLLAQESPQTKADVEARLRTAQQRAASPQQSSSNATFDSSSYDLSVSTFRFQQSSEPTPLYTNPGDAQGILLPANAIYGQSQSGTFGATTAEWLGLGKSLFPSGDPNAPYGLRLNWDSNLAVFNLINSSTAGVKNLAIGFGGNSSDQLVFQYFPSVTSSSSTRVAFLSSRGLFRNISAVRSGSETGNSEAPFVNTSPGYIGLVNRRINSTNAGAGQVLARTNILTLERDGTSGGLRINNPSGTTFQNLACLGTNSSGGFVGRAFIVPPGVTSVYTDGQAIVYATCTFGDSYFLNNITQVTLQRYPSDFYWVGTVNATVNQ